jgi:uncharacterized protein DUF6101
LGRTGEVRPGGEQVSRHVEGNEPVPVRLDPFALPLRFTASDPCADAGARLVELSRDRVRVRRAVRGIRMAVTVPIAAFTGVSLRICREPQTQEERLAIALEHRDPGLCIPLLAGAPSFQAIPEWHLWARVLGLPLLVADLDGRLHEPFRRIGAVRLVIGLPRRRRRLSISRRRPTLPLRRRSLRVGAPRIYRGEREIIARN